MIVGSPLVEPPTYKFSYILPGEILMCVRGDAAQCVHDRGVQA